MHECPLLSFLSCFFCFVFVPPLFETKTRQFAKVMNVLAIEMTRTTTEVLLRDLGVLATCTPSERCVDYKKLLKRCKTMS